MIDTDAYENMTWETPSDELEDAVENLLAVVKRLAVSNYDLLAEVKRLRVVINKAMQQHTVLRMRGELFESSCIDAEGQYESGHWEREEE